MRPAMIRLAAALLCGALLSAGQSGHAQSAGPVEQLRAYRFAADRAPMEAAAAWIAERRTTPAGRVEAAEALATLLGGEATFEARQFACRELVRLAGPGQVPALAGLVSDPQLGHFAVMVLARIPGPESQAALVRALGVSPPSVLPAVIETLGARGGAGVSALIAPSLASTDRAVAEAAAVALGHVADRAARTALLTAFRRGAPSRVRVGDALLECAGRLAKAGSRAEATAIYAALDAKSAGPMLRAAALRGVVQLRGAAALPLVLAALNDDRSARQRMAAGLVRDFRAELPARSLASRMRTLSPGARVLVLRLLAERGDRSVAADVAAACASPDAATRSAAAAALGVLGRAGNAGLLLRLAGGPTDEERTAARQALARMSDPALSAVLLAAVHSSIASLSVEAIRAVGERKTPGAVPGLMTAVRSGPTPVRVAALTVLRDQGSPRELPALLDGMLRAAGADREAMHTAIGAIVRRGRTDADRTDALLASLGRASAARDRVDLLGLVADAGGPRALAAVRADLSHADADVRAEALARLTEWPGDEALPDLLTIARSGAEARTRTLALRGYLQAAGNPDARSAVATLALYRGVADLAVRPEERRIILGALAKAPSKGALDYAASMVAEADLRAEAEQAVAEIGLSTAGSFPEATRTALQPLSVGAADPAVRKKAADALDLIGKGGEFISAWEVSPAYAREGMGFSALFDLVLPPEDPAAAPRVAWRLMPMNAAAPWMADLLALWGGEQKAAFVRTNVYSPDERDLVLELGSDDGVKVWWNGALAYSLNCQRGIAPAQDKIKVRTKAGWNSLMIKVAQNVMGWAVAVRVVGWDGSTTSAIRTATNEEAAGAAR